MYLQINILSMTKMGLKEIKSSLSHYVYKKILQLILIIRKD